MLPPNLAAILIAPLVGSLRVSASPFPANEVDYHKLLETIPVEGGTVTVYGYSGIDPPQTGGDLVPACGSNAVTCDYNNHLAAISTCNALITALRSDPGHDLPESPRDVCFNGDGRCCVSWHNPVGGLKWGHLVDAAQVALNTCRNANNNRVSGKTSDTLLASTCTSQCLSDRPNGC